MLKEVKDFTSGIPGVEWIDVAGDGNRTTAEILNDHGVTNFQVHQKLLRT